MIRKIRKTRSLLSSKTKLTYYFEKLTSFCHNEHCKTISVCPRICCMSDNLNIETAVIWKLAEEIGFLSDIIHFQRIYPDNIESISYVIDSLQWILTQHELKSFNSKQWNIIKSSINYSQNLIEYIKDHACENIVKPRDIFKI